MKQPCGGLRGAGQLPTRRPAAQGQSRVWRARCAKHFHITPHQPPRTFEELTQVSQHFLAVFGRLGAVGQFLKQSTPFGNVFGLGALKSPEEHLRCFGVVPTPFQRFDDGALMGDVLPSAFYVAFDFLKPPLQFSAVHSAV
jgi:hypothetical protein